MIDPICLALYRKHGSRENYTDETFTTVSVNYDAGLKLKLDNGIEYNIEYKRNLKKDIERKKNEYLPLTD